MVTTRQLPVLIYITEALRKKEMSIAELQRELNMKRSTLVYYLGILESRGYIIKEVEEKKQGKPTLIKFNEKKYREDREAIVKRRKEEREKMLNHPLTFQVLNLLKKDPKLAKKELHGKTTDYVRKASHLNWLIGEGLIVQEFSITPKGKKFIEEHKEKS